MRLRAFLTDHLSDLEVAQSSNEPWTKHKADHQCSDARGRGAERDEAYELRQLRIERLNELVKVKDHPANSAVIRSTTASVLIPRDPFTSTRSPSDSHDVMASAAALLVFDQLTASRFIPAAMAASASAFAGSPPTVIN